MLLISTIGAFIFTGVAVWVVDRYLPVGKIFKMVFNGIVFILVIVWFLAMMGLLGMRAL
jgi:hypothetical protein